jgi:hypothetical protein
MIGGWEFVQAAYAVAYGSLGFYAVALLVRAKRVLSAPSGAKAPP